MIMRKFLLVLLIFAGSVFSVSAQDLITKKDGNEIRAKVTEVDLEVIRYKQFDNQTGPTYVMSKSEIFRIKYENGRIEVFDVAPSPATGTTPTAGTTATPPSQQRIPVTASPYQRDWKVQMRANAPEVYKRYRKGARQAGIGLGLVAGGTAVMIAGYAVAFSTIDENTFESNDLGEAGTGLGIAAVGAICATVGTPIMIVGFVRRGKAKREYFSQYANRTYVQKSPLQSPHFELRTNGIAFVF
jgi:hypothetical protein